MRKLILILIGITIYSCEDVIDLDLNTSQPKLIIEASINWVKETSGNEQEIKLSLSTPFYDIQTPPANNAQVSVFDTNGNEFIFIEDGVTGIYKNNTFIPVLNASSKRVFNSNNCLCKSSLDSAVLLASDRCSLE